VSPSYHSRPADRSAAENIIGLYQRHGRDWARDILDLGCGSGEPIGRYFIGHGYRLTGIGPAAVTQRVEI